MDNLLPFIIQYSKAMKITNTAHLSRGTGAKYLLVIKGEDDVLIAKAWKRTLPKRIKSTEILIKF
jgi:hypothetical protein